MTDISSQILAPGGTITLASGDTINVRYGMRAIKVLEDEFGSVNALVAKLGEAADGDFFTTISKAIWAGTSRSVAYEDFLDLLDPRQLSAYVEVFATAIGEALGSGEAKAADQAAPATA